MRFLLGCVGWAVLIAGALPKPGQRWIEDKIAWWSARWASGASAVLEAALGYFLMRSLLIETGIADALPRHGMVKVTLGLFLAAEGVIRLLIATQGAASGSLPAIAIWRAVSAVRLRRVERKRRVSGPTR
jgi:hypothetical protein